MNEQEFDRRWSDRSDRYPGTGSLPAGVSVHLHVDPGYAGTYSGQVAAITAASLFGRMTKCVAVDVPPLPILDPLPWAGAKLDEFVMQTLHDAHRFGKHEQRVASTEDLRLVIGSRGDGLVVHGSGWGAYRGHGSSPLLQSDDPNPFGAAFAVIDAAAQIQLHPDASGVESEAMDTYLWRAGIPSADTPRMEPRFELGNVWSIGVGSVGSCALFFLGLITQNFRSVLVDRDNVEIENVTRSALFSWRDALREAPKVDVAARWLHEARVGQIEPLVAWLDEIPDHWARRPTGTPDLLISAANERNVRSVIEGSHPPLQVYATTGQNWQATLFRHIPLADACSRCVPNEDAPQMPMLCATGSRAPEETSEDADDVALPFLSYAAGLMTAAEISKLALLGRTEASNRVFYQPRGRGLVSVELSRDPECRYHNHDTTHEAAIQGSRFASLSTSVTSRAAWQSTEREPTWPR